MQPYLNFHKKYEPGSHVNFWNGSNITSQDTWQLQWHFWLLIAKDFWQKPDTLVRCSQRSKWRLSSWRFSFCGRRCISEVSHPQQYSMATRDTVVPMNIEVLTKYPLSYNDRIVVLEIRLHGESLMLYRPELHGDWNVLSLARRALKDKFPMPTIPLTAMLPNHQVFLPDPV